MARRKKSIEKESKPAAEFVSTPADKVPGFKTFFKKGKEKFHLGDTLIAGIGDEAYEGELINVLGSQFVIKGEQCPHGKFFFYNGTKIQKK